MHDAILYPEHNQMQLLHLGRHQLLPAAGSHRGDAAGPYPNLQPGDVLIFQEMMGPQTGIAADADLRHRCAVRLTAVATQRRPGQTLVDPLFDQGAGDPITSAAQQPTPVTEIQWSADDALPFPVCISSTYPDSTGNAA